MMNGEIYLILMISFYNNISAIALTLMVALFISSSIYELYFDLSKNMVACYIAIQMFLFLIFVLGMNYNGIPL